MATNSCIGRPSDLTSYDRKHNEANGEDNRDGENDNLSWNCGVEGPTDDRAILELRRRQMRNLMATLFTSLGVPMLSGGDEVGRTQRGNNNAYCQDSELTWTPWDLAPWQQDFLAFTRRVTAMWRSQAVMHRRKFLQGRAIRGADVKDITWLTPKGQEMTDADWNHPDARCLGVRIAGDIDEVDERGERIVGDTLLLLFNADAKPAGFVLPKDGSADRWEPLVDTPSPTRGGSLAAAETYRMESRSLAVLRLVVGAAPTPGFRT